MAKRNDWMPGTRTGQLNMAKDWKILMNANASAWGIPSEVLTDFDGLIQAADSALNTAENELTRTPVATARCKEAFDGLTAKMRDIKRRYFLTPPLKDSDYVGLSLNIPDDTPTPIGVPTAQVTIETFLAGRHELGFKIVYLTGDHRDKANKGYSIWYALVAPGEKSPTNPDELHKFVFTKRKRDIITFDFEDSGKTAHFAVQVENDGKKGPWGPMVSALIP